MADFLEQVLGEAEPATPVEEPIVGNPAVEPIAEVASEPVAPAAEVVAQPEAAKPEPGYVPISALMDERDKRKAAEAKAQQYAPHPQQQQAPDPFDDPQAFAQYQHGLVQQAIVADRF